MRVNIPGFDGNTLNPEGFIDWLVAVEELFEFKEVPENKRVSLIATKLRGKASAWWQQLKLIRERIGKPRIDDQLVSRYIYGLRVQIMDSINMFNPVTLSDAYQRALAFEKQNQRVGRINPGIRVNQQERFCVILFFFTTSVVTPSNLSMQRNVEYPRSYIIGPITQDLRTTTKRVV
ncbi:hypothetical protein Tco_0013194 [Tanacetum coccineum]